MPRLQPLPLPSYQGKSNKGVKLPPPPPPPHTQTHTPILGLTVVARVAEKKLEKKGSKVEFPIKTSAKYVL